MITYSSPEVIGENLLIMVMTSEAVTGYNIDENEL